MADAGIKVTGNHPGPWFVDQTCINCDTCRQLASNIFAEVGAFSAVVHQPTTAEQRFCAARALVACPTGSIGFEEPSDNPENSIDYKSLLHQAQDSFPEHLSDGVYFCGYTSALSYGGKSYFIAHPQGNWLIDAPRYSGHLVEAFKQLGGVKWIFLTHQDDVADASRYAKTFGATRLIHENDAEAQPEAERFIRGDEPVLIGEDFEIIPTPGHTKGHMVLRYKSDFLFSGDHLWWEEEHQQLGASKAYCWYDWPTQVASLKKLAPLSVRWVLPGHGAMKQIDPAQMNQALAALLTKIETSG